MNIIANYIRPCFETADYSIVAEKLFRGLMVTLCRLSVKEMLPFEIGYKISIACYIYYASYLELLNPQMS